MSDHFSGGEHRRERYTLMLPYTLTQFRLKGKKKGSLSPNEEHGMGVASHLKWYQIWELYLLKSRIESSIMDTLQSSKISVPHQPFLCSTPHPNYNIRSCLVSHRTRNTTQNTTSDKRWQSLGLTASQQASHYWGRYLPSAHFFDRRCHLLAWKIH